MEVDSSPAASLEEDEPQCEAQASSMVAGSWDGVEAMDEPLSPLLKISFGDSAKDMWNSTRTLRAQCMHSYVV